MGLNSPDRQSGGYAGSPKSGEPVYLVVGRLRKPHGVLGEILMDILTDFPERFDPPTVLLVGEKYKKFTLTNCRWHQDSLLVKFDGIDDRDQAGLYRNVLVYAEASSSPKLPDGEYYQHELIGLTVFDEAGDLQGKLVEILTTGSNDVYVVLFPSGEETLLPALESVILKVNLSEKTMIVRPPEWA